MNCESLKLYLFGSTCSSCVVSKSSTTTAMRILPAKSVFGQLIAIKYFNCQYMSNLGIYSNRISSQHLLYFFSFSFLRPYACQIHIHFFGIIFVIKENESLVIRSNMQRCRSARKSSAAASICK